MVDERCYEVRMSACHIEPPEKKKLVGEVGEELVARHGKRKYYAPKQIESAALRRGYGVDVHCWAYCIFSTPDDFRALHEAAGEVCDYAVMRAGVLAELAAGEGFQWPDIDLSWLEWPDLDLSGIFDWFDAP